VQVERGHRLVRGHERLLEFQRHVIDQLKKNESFCAMRYSRTLRTPAVMRLATFAGSPTMIS
jgi:hypothetical protein